MGFTYPPVIHDSQLYNPLFYASLGSDGVLTYDYAQTLYLGKNDYRLSYISGIVPGTAYSGIALVPGDNNDISGLGAVSCTSLNINGASVSGAPSYVLGITPGMAANSKALVLGASGEIATISSLTATSITGTLQTAAQPNITTIGTLTGLTIAGNLTFTGASRTITGLTSLTASNLTGTLQTAAQPNITSLGTLSSLTASSITGTLQTAAQPNITSLGTLTAVNCSGNVSGTLTTAAQPNITSLGTLMSLNVGGSISVGSTVIVDSSRNATFASITGTIQTAAQANITSLGTLTSLNVGGNSIITAPAASTLSSTSPSSAYPLQFRNASNVSGAACGISFAIHEEATLSNYTPNASIIVYTEDTGASNIHAAGVFSIRTRGMQIQTDGSMTERMRIDSSGRFSFSSNIGDGNWNFLSGGDATIRYGSSLTAKNCISLYWNYQSSGSSLNYLAFNIYGTTNALTIQASDRVGVRTNLNTTCFDVVGDATLFDGTYQRIAQFRNNNASPIAFEIQVSNAAAGSGAVWMGTQSTDALRLGVNSNTVMYLNSSSKVGIMNTSPEATLHVGGMSWSNGFYSKQDGAAGPALSWRSIQLTSYIGIGLYQTNTASIRLGTCDATFAWNGYATVYGGSYTNASDRDYKKDIEDISYGLDTVLAMRPREFTWKQDDRRSIGFIAQEMLEVCPIPVSGDPDRPINEETGMPNDGMGVDLGSLTAVLCKAIQEQQQQINDLKKNCCHSTVKTSVAYENAARLPIRCRLA